MEPNKWFKKLSDKFKDDPNYKTEMLQLDVTEQILELLNSGGYSRTQLADKLKCSTAYITKLLNGSENLTLRKLVEIAHALECTIDVAFVPCQYQIHRTFVYVSRAIQKTNFDKQIEMPTSYESYLTIAA